MPSRSAWTGLQAALPTDESYLDEYGVTSVGLQVYTRGECWYLAWVLHQLTGFDLVAVATRCSDLEDLFWAHVLIQLPDGRLLDVLGIQQPQDVVDRWSKLRRRKLRLIHLGRLSAPDYEMLLDHDLDVPAHFADLSTEVALHLLSQVAVDLAASRRAREESLLA